MREVKKILLVDDEPDILFFFTLTLEQEGYAVIQAGNADDAIAKARAELPDLICLDIMMPRKSGLACYKTLRQEPALRTTPVLIVSAFGQPQDFKGERFRVIIQDPDIPEPDGYLEKPVKAPHFAAVIRGIIGPPQTGETP
jgi:CheY-like chemotaxis protein